MAARSWAAAVRGKADAERPPAAAAPTSPSPTSATAASVPMAAVACDTHTGVPHPHTGTGAGKFRFLCVLDFEATCEEDVKIKPQEIIQFPSVLIDLHAAGAPAVVAELDQFVRPVVHPVLSRFCTRLTGITQAQVDAGCSIQDAIVAHRRWLASHVLPHATAAALPADVDARLAEQVLVVTCGDWDLKTALPQHLADIGEGKPPVYLRSWHNAKVGYSEAMGAHPRGMPDMLRGLGLRLEGRHHNGLDDCKNIARVMLALVKRGLVVEQTGTLGTVERSRRK